MTKNIMRKGLVIFLITIILMIIFGNLTPSYGASWSVSSPTKSVAKGKTFTVTVSVSGLIGKFTISGSNCSVNKSSEWVEGNGTITITATAANSTGTAKVTVTAADVADASTAVAVTGSKSVSVTITEPAAPVKSNNANLSNLGIRPNDFSGFKASTTSYSVSVPNSVSSVEIYATKAHSGAKVVGTGSKTLKEGKNTFTITVTAEDGKTTKTYTLNITRKAPGDEPPVVKPPVEEPIEPIEEPVEVVLGLKSLVIQGIEFLPTFNKELTSYTCEIDADIDTLEINAVADPDEARVEIIGNTQLQPGENIITILVKLGNETVTYQLVVNKAEPEEDEVVPVAAGVTDDIDRDTMIKTGIVVGSIAGIIGISIGINIALYAEKIKIAAGKISKIPVGGTPEVGYESSFTDETDFGSFSRGGRGKHL